MQNMYQGLNLKLRVPLVTNNELFGCQLLLRTSKSAGARGDVQNFGGCQAPAAPVLTQALFSIPNYNFDITVDFLKNDFFNENKKIKVYYINV